MRYFVVHDLFSFSIIILRYSSGAIWKTVFKVGTTAFLSHFILFLAPALLFPMVFPFCPYFLVAEGGHDSLNCSILEHIYCNINCSKMELPNVPK